MSGASPKGPPPLFGEAHARRYLETNGAEGHDWQGVSTLVLFTRGRRSGRWRATPLIYAREGAALVVVASKGGAPSDPAWYRNLVDAPEVEAQVGPERVALRARTTTGAERARLWERMAAIWPAYDEYRARTAREIPVVLLAPRSAAAGR